MHPLLNYNRITQNNLLKHDPATEHYDFQRRKTKGHMKI